MAPGPSGGIWLAARDAVGGGAALVALDAAGHVTSRRPLPGLRGPVDFLGIDVAGLGHALEAAGTPGARVVAFTPGQRVRSVLHLAPGSGPQVPHPAALSPDGALLVLQSTPDGLDLRRLPPGRQAGTVFGRPAA
jgi:hypothetical protein